MVNHSFHQMVKPYGFALIDSVIWQATMWLSQLNEFVTDLLQSGQNAISAILGHGWYRGRLGFGGGKRNMYGDNLALLAQLEVQYADGSSERIVIDENWYATTGAILMSSIYNGETYDARSEPVGWTEGGFDDSNWAPVRRLE